MSRNCVVILGAAGRDFHCFNTVYRADPDFEVVAFTAAQIPGIAMRRYPAALSGPLYPDGIPIEDEAELESLCRHHEIERVVFAYSDLTHADVMHLVLLCHKRRVPQDGQQGSVAVIQRAWRMRSVVSEAGW